MFQVTAHLRHPAPFRFPLAHRLGALHRAIAARLRLWRERARARDELRWLDEAILRDVGMSRSQASFDADRPFWRE